MISVPIRRHVVGLGRIELQLEVELELGREVLDLAQVPDELRIVLHAAEREGLHERELRQEPEPLPPRTARHRDDAAHRSRAMKRAVVAGVACPGESAVPQPIEIAVRPVRGRAQDLEEGVAALVRELLRLVALHEDDDHVLELEPARDVALRDVDHDRDARPVARVPLGRLQGRRQDLVLVWNEERRLGGDRILARSERRADVLGSRVRTLDERVEEPRRRRILALREVGLDGGAKLGRRGRTESCAAAAWTIASSPHVAMTRIARSYRIGSSAERGPQGTEALAGFENLIG